MKPKIIQIISLSITLLPPLSGSGAELGTRQRTITPVVLTNAPTILASNLPAYAAYGYNAWQWGPGTNEGQLWTTNAPASFTAATNAARLLTFFCISDIHITDKESPSQSLWPGYQTETGSTSDSLPPGNDNSSCYSPVILRTTQVLDAAVRTANDLNRLMSFDFGMSLGDDCNSAQHNELRWFIDVMDGKYITPSSGTNAGAATIDYQKPYQAAGLNPAIPWYQVLGNHDHFWCGCLVVNDYLRQSATNNTVLLLGALVTAQDENSRADFMGTVDGTTPYGTIINSGSVSNYIVDGVTNAPTVAADTNRYSLTRSNWMAEFFNTTSQPVGHGFSPANVTNDFACYSFMPKTNLPLKVIVLDDTMSDTDFDFNGQGGLDETHFNWLTNELQLGQNADQLMIVAAHIPIELIDVPEGTNLVSVSEPQLLTALHSYPNLILWVAGHMHRNNIKSEMSTNDPAYDFWEVENPSLRDFPEEFRTFEILRNTDNSISIVTTDIDPEVTPGSNADKSRGYAVGASRIFSVPCAPPVSVGDGLWNFTDIGSYTTNAELIKFLTPHMQGVIANLGGPLGYNVAIDYDGTGVTINFLGELQSADTVLGPWSDVTDTSPYAVSATNGAKFYRACESDSSNSTPIATDYSKTNHWLTVPATNMLPVDIFYLYPTSWTNSNLIPEVCAIDNPSMLQLAPQAFAKTATAFETVGNIYAPFYRQSNLTSNALVTEAGIPTTDAIAAFDYYIQHFNQGRPFILAAHSQGAYVLSKLLVRYMKDHRDVYARMIAAYVIGWPVTAQYLADHPHLKFAEGPDDTGVIISYNTQAPDVPPGVNPVLWGLVGTVINPITWTRSETLATTNQGFGSFMPNTNGVYVQVPQYADARIDITNGVLICSTADTNTIGVQGIYHNFDFPFYYFNIRSNAANRVAKFLAAEQ
jgi:metallophosphoesterase (TIGR03768 family)